DRARLAFAWAVRQVRLWPPAERDAARLLPHGDRAVVVPPHLVLRRGWGSAAERALVFLGLLHQLGIDGCLGCLPGAREGPASPWACGARAGDGLLLFDPCLGLPLPGRKPGEVATLAEVRAHPELLKALAPEEKQHPDAKQWAYDVTAEQVAKAE